MKLYFCFHFILVQQLSYSIIVQNCKKSEPCSFLGKDLGWELYQDSPTYALQYPPKKEEEWKDPTVSIYLTVSSYRDKLCPRTLKYLYTKASFPSRVFVGVVQQNEESDLDCLNHYCELMRLDGYRKHLPKDFEPKFTEEDYICPYKDNIRMKRVPAALARGPTWARAQGFDMLHDEEFCMQTDAHMDFLPAWDVNMLKMWAGANNEYAVLSTYVYPTDMYEISKEENGGVNGVFEVPNLCMVTLEGEFNMVRNWGAKCLRNMKKPKLTNAIWGAGLSFSKCHAERKVKVDPHTPNIFDGEEFSKAMRYWTFGYDIYSPHRVYVLHDYNISQADPLHFGWAVNKKYKDSKESVFRLKTLLEMPEGSTDPAYTLALQQSLYGLGDRRTLDQAIAFSGIDTKNRRILGNRCGNLDYVPFVEHPWGPDYIPKYNTTTEVYMDVRDPGSIYFNKDGDMLEAWIRADAEMQRTRRAIQEQREKVEQAKKAALLLEFQRQIQEAQHLAQSHNSDNNHNSNNNNNGELHAQSNAESFNEQLRLAKEAAMGSNEDGLLNLARFIPHHKIYIIGLAAILSFFLFRLYFHKNLRMAGRLQHSALGYLVNPIYPDDAVKVV
mmetsp:Transcript_20911/g.29022  ORF Transcript_20911/g.29022 Transcript_20911/m.29022 type:complete len:610 (+) Transcript_20911:1-1830(+)